MSRSSIQKLDGIRENELLAKHTWFKIGGPAKYFFEAKNNQDLVRALKAADAAGVKRFILGGGSNILVADSGFDGLVIKQANKSFEIKAEEIFCESGALVTEVLAASLKAGLVGWPWAAGLPGTVGGAVRGNAGAYGQGMADIVKEAEIYGEGKVNKLTGEEMKFSYRHSIAKEKNLVVISATLKLKPGDTSADEALVKKYNDHRKKTQPLELPNAGCVFKNVDLSQVEINQAKVKKALDINDQEFQEATKFGKLPVSFIIDRLNLKGKQIGGAQVSEKHGAFIVNTGRAKAEHVIMLISDLKMRVRNELGIQLEEEVQYVGF